MFYLSGMKYDADLLAAHVVIKRQIRNRLTIREAAEQIGVSIGTVHRAEVRKGLSEQSFLKICAWLEKDPAAYQIETT